MKKQNREIKTYTFEISSLKRYSLTLISRKPLNSEIRILLVDLSEKMETHTKWKLPTRKSRGDTNTPQGN